MADLLSLLLLLPLKLISLPIHYTLYYTLHLLAILFAPALHLLSYARSGLQSIFNLIASLKPLYTFCATAFAVGILAGIALATSSSFITFHLGMHDSDNYEFPEEMSFRDSSPKQRQWAHDSPPRRRPATGLLSQTIIEEDSDDV